MLVAQPPPRPIRQADAPAPAGASRQVLWVGSEALSARRERSVLKAEGFVVVFRPLAGTVAVAGRSVAGPRLAPETHELLAGPGIAVPTDEAGGRLRQDFTAVVVESDVSVLASYVRSFPGTILFRSYGLMVPLADQLWENGTRELMAGRNNVHYLPTLETPGDPDWLRAITTALPSLQVIANDVVTARWEPSRAVGPAVVAIAGVGEPDYDRRLAAFMAEAFGDRTLFDSIDLRGRADEAGLSLFDRAEASRLCRASALLHIDQAAPFLHGFVQQALLMGVPVVCFAGSALARMIGTGAGQAATVGEALTLIGRLAAGDWDLSSAILQAQGHAAERLRSTQTPEYFANHLPSLITRASGGPLEPQRSQPDQGANNYAQLERLLAALSQDPADLAGNPLQARHVVECLFHMLLQRDPDVEELDRLMRRVAEERGPLRTARGLLCSAEGRAVWPDNRLHAWLALKSE